MDGSAGTDPKVRRYIVMLLLAAVTSGSLVGILRASGGDRICGMRLREVLVDAGYFRTLYDYHYWARDRLLRAAEGMTADEYGANNGFTYNGLRPMLTHTLNAEVAWLNRMRGETAERLEPPTEEALPTVEALAARWAEVEAVQRAFLADLRD